MASTSWLTRCAVAPASTSASATTRSLNVTVYSSEPFDVGVWTSCTPSAFGDTTTTALLAVTIIQPACSAYATPTLVPDNRPLAKVVAGRSGNATPGSLSAAVSTAPFATPAR